MIKQTVREFIAEHRGNFTRIDAILCTTFTFHSEFFENNVLPTIFNIENRSEQIRRFKVNSELQKVPTAVFYDANNKAYNKGKYRYQTIGIQLMNRFFHPKNIIIAGLDEDGNPMVFVSSASANIGMNGWGKQEEVISGVFIQSSRQQPVVELKKLLKFLRDEATVEIQAIKVIEKSLQNLQEMPKTEADARELYFIGLEEGVKFQTYLKDNKEGHRWDTLYIISPFWEDLIEQFKEFNCKEYYIIPALKTSPDKKGKYGIAFEQFEELRNEYGEKVSSWDFKAKSNEDWGWTFRHAKAYIITKADRIRIGIGSCNCTKAGLSRNIESMIVFDEERKFLNEFDESLKQIRLTKDNAENTNEDMPEHIPFSISVIYDWKTKEYQIVYKCEDEKVTSSSLKLPSVELPVELKTTERLALKVELKKSDVSEFRIDYIVDNISKYYIGIILEVNLDFTEREYTRKFKYDEILESWKRGEDAWIEISSRVPGEDEDDNGESVESNGPKNAIPEDIFNLYEEYRAFYDLNYKLKEAKKIRDKDKIKALLEYRPDSVKKLFEALILMEDHKHSYLLMKECLKILEQYKQELSSEELLVSVTNNCGERRIALLEVLHNELGIKAKDDSELPERMLSWFESKILN